MTKTPIVRFAPSPTGRLHVGNIRTAMFNWLFAKPNGTFVLRLDDTDVARSTQAYADGIVEDLNWLGIVPDKVEKQSDRFAAYEAAADQLKSAGLLYPCYESADQIERSRKRLMARGKPPVYDRAALKLSAEDRAQLEADGRKPHWRFMLPNFSESPFETQRTEIVFEDIYRGRQVVDLASMSDPILQREDGSWLYTLPSVVDDRDMGITHVLRGGDHVANTGVQIALFKALNAPSVPQFGHHNLLTDSDGEGLSKRKGSVSIEYLRESGLEPMAVASLSALTGTDKDIVALNDLTDLGAHFTGASVSKGPARFNEQELAALNERIIHAMPFDVAKLRFEKAGINLGEEEWNLFRENLLRFSDIADWAPIVSGSIPCQVDPDDVDFLKLAAEKLPAEPWPENVWSIWTTDLKVESGRKGKGLFMPLRKALTGKSYGPDMGELLPLIGRDRAADRLKSAV